MTSKERVRAAAQHKKVDRVPAAFEAVWPVWLRLLKEYKFTKVEEVYQKYNVDTRYVNPVYVGPKLSTYVNEAGNKVVKSFWGYEEEIYSTGKDQYAITCFYPLSGIETIEQVDSYAWPNPGWFDYDSMLTECEQHPDKAMVMGHEGPFQVATYLMEMSEFFMLMIDAPEVAQRILDKINQFEMEYYERAFKACNGKIDILRTHDDYGTQISLMFGVDTWRAFFLKNTENLTNLAHKYNAFFQQHSCGAVEPLIEDFIAAGVDILEPLQKVIGLDPENLKTKYGGRIAFFGGIDTQDLLPYGKPEEVKAETRRYIDILGSAGGYILSSSQAFETDISTANIEAVFETDRRVQSR